MRNSLAVYMNFMCFLDSWRWGVWSSTWVWLSCVTCLSKREHNLYFSTYWSSPGDRISKTTSFSGWEQQLSHCASCCLFSFSRSHRFYCLIELFNSSTHYLFWITVTSIQLAHQHNKWTNLYFMTTYLLLASVCRPTWCSELLILKLCLHYTEIGPNSKFPPILEWPSTKSCSPPLFGW